MSDEILCPKCSGPTWDNTKDKKSSKHPDYRCKDRENCDGAIWLDKKKTSQLVSKALDPREGYSGPPLPNETPAEAAGVTAKQPPSLCGDWLKALDMVLEKGLPKLEAKGIPVDASAVFAATATVFIAKSRSRQG